MRTKAWRSCVDELQGKLDKKSGEWARTVKRCNTVSCQRKDPLISGAARLWQQRQECASRIARLRQLIEIWFNTAVSWRNLTWKTKNGKWKYFVRHLWDKDDVFSLALKVLNHLQFLMVFLPGYVMRTMIFRHEIQILGSNQGRRFMICIAFSSLVCSLDALSIKFSYSRHSEAWGDLPEREEGQHVHCRLASLQTNLEMYWNVVWCHACDHPFRWRCRCGPTCQTLASLPSPARAYAGKAGFTDLWKLHHVCLLDLAAFNWHSRFVLFNLFHMIYGLQMFHSEPRKLKWNPGVNPCLSCGAIVFCRLESAITQALSLRLDGRKSQKFSIVVKLRMQCSVGIQWITLWLVPLPSCGSRMLSVLLWHFMTSWHFHVNFTELVQLSKCLWELRSTAVQAFWWHSGELKSSQKIFEWLDVAVHLCRA